MKRLHTYLVKFTLDGVNRGAIYNVQNQTMVCDFTYDDFGMLGKKYIFVGGSGLWDGGKRKYAQSIERFDGMGEIAMIKVIKWEETYESDDGKYVAYVTLVKNQLHSGVLFDIITFRKWNGALMLYSETTANPYIERADAGIKAVIEAHIGECHKVDSDIQIITI